jgi:hypothetical protein
LNLDAAFEIQTPHLGLCLDTFGGSGHPKAHSKSCYGADNRKASFIDEQVSDERLINLDLVEWKTTKVANTGIAGAKIVHRYSNAKVSQLIEDCNIPL